jgi:small subunit ribosomal protein S15
MSIDKERKQAIVKDFAKSDKDTGSPEVQIALWTERIREITEHLKVHKKDFHTRRGLIAMVNNRRRQMDYLKHQDAERYQALIQRLGLRK